MWGQRWSRVTGSRSRVAAAGSRWWQEWGDAAGPGLGEGGVPEVRSKGGRNGVPTAACYSAREEGTGSAGTLGEESCNACMCLHHVTGVSLPLTLTWANSTAGSPVNMALQLLQSYNIHPAWTGWDDGSCNLATEAELHGLCKTAVPIQECCTTCGPPAAYPPITVSAADPPITVRHPLMSSATVLTVLSLLCFVVERYDSVP